MAEYVKQHYIPQFWMKNFSDDKKYVNFVNKNGKESFEKIDDLFVFKNLYDLPEGDIKELEKCLSTLENDAKLIFDKLNSGKEITLTSREYETLHIFLKVQLSRSKINNNPTVDEEAAVNLNKLYEGKSFNKAWKDFLMALATSRTYEEFFSKNLISKKVRIMEYVDFTEKHICVLEIKSNEKVSFVLSDYLPLPYSVGSEKGWLDLIDFFPISRNRVVVICYSNFKKLRRDLIPVSIDSLHKPLRDNDGNYKIRVGTMYKKGVQTINEIFKSHCYEGFIY